MAGKTIVGAVKNKATGSYTVAVPKSAMTGRFVGRTSGEGKIKVLGSGKKAS